MVRSISNKAGVGIQAVLERALAQGCISRREHLQLTSVILGNQWLTEDERRQINRIFDYVQTGRLKLVD
ncbi:MAG TPA: hypothetical protein IGS37_10970 [Synechococcales cyanobacterium M55_K2018_004]|nr:hypothetical protein [Synechococcales cyanobacterium M55_K2018_004]